jgi:hypothetical protein
MVGGELFREKSIRFNSGGDEVRERYSFLKKTKRNEYGGGRRIGVKLFLEKSIRNNCQAGKCHTTLRQRGECTK